MTFMDRTEARIVLDLLLSAYCSECEGYVRQTVKQFVNHFPEHREVAEFSYKARFKEELYD